MSCAPDHNILPLALFNCENRRQRIVLHTHTGDRLAQFLLVRVRQQHNRFVAVVYLAIGEARLIGKNELDMIVAGNISRGDNRELAPVDVAIETDRANQPAGNAAPHRSAVPHPIAFNVVHIARASQQLVHTFLAGNRDAYDAGFLLRTHRWGASNQGAD